MTVLQVESTLYAYILEVDPRLCDSISIVEVYPTLCDCTLELKCGLHDSILEADFQICNYISEYLSVSWQ